MFSIQTRFRIGFIVLLAVGVLSNSNRASEPDLAVIEFFESKVRPLLEDRCIECHDRGGEINGGLILSDGPGVFAGGESGAAIEPNQPDASRLMQAVLYTDPYLQMPPDEPLSTLQQNILRKWIADGAIDPRPLKADDESAKTSTALPLERASEHWAYREIASPPIPNQSASSDNPIDRFLAVKIQSEELTPERSADHSVLLRRLTFDLHGLPPTVEQLDNVRNAGDDDAALIELIDHLLASPRFGERFARHWMDIARYADSLTLRGFVLENAWRYRNYLINRFNDDTPVDQMIREQIAGDLLAAHDSTASIQLKQRYQIAATYLLLGNWNLEEQDKAQLEMDIVDEQLDVISKGLLAQTITCARCHDHKFDPIPTSDYYALAGILKASVPVEHSNVSRWIDVPLPLEPQQQVRFTELENTITTEKQNVALLQKQLNASKPKQDVVVIDSLKGFVIDDADALKVGQWQASTHNKPYVGAGYVHDQNANKGAASITFTPVNLPPGQYNVRLAYQNGDTRSTKVHVTVASADGEAMQVLNQTLPPPIDHLWIDLGRFRFERDGQAYVLISNLNSSGHVIADAVQFLPLSDSEDANVVLDDAVVRDEQTRMQTALTQAKHRLAQAENKLKERPVCMGIRIGEIQDLPIHIRGSVHSLGKLAPRGFPQFAKLDIAIAARQSGRLELAEWIVDRRNPLTSRVYVNRIWKHLMGRGLVESLDNFGTTGSTPTHPELLDYLASEFMRHDWSTKWLVKEIVCSAAYQRTASTTGLLDAEAWQKMEAAYAIRTRKRLDAEAVRDAILLASGELDFTPITSQFVTGLTNDFAYKFGSNCRSIYLPVFRNSMHPLMQVWDGADASTVVGSRNETIVATQSLMFLNSQWMADRAAAIAVRFLEEQELSSEERLTLISQSVLGRSLHVDEQQLILEYLNRHGPADANEVRRRWKDIVQSLLSSIDFRYLD